MSTACRSVRPVRALTSRRSRACSASPSTHRLLTAGSRYKPRVALEGAILGNAGKEGPLQFMVRGPLPVLAAALAIGGATPAFAASTEDAARDYVSTHAGQFGVQSADVADLSVLSSYKTSGTGVTHVSVAQRREGYDVFGSQVTVNVGRDGRVVFAGGQPVQGAARRRDAGDARRDRRGRGRGAGARARRARRAAGDASRFGQGAEDRADRRRHLGVADRGQARLALRRRGSLRLAWQVVIDAASESRTLERDGRRADRRRCWMPRT